MSTTPLEHDYIGLSESSSVPRSSDKLSYSSSSSSCTEENYTSSNKACLNFKETELRLGLPGSQSPGRKPSHGLSLFGKDIENNNSNSNSNNTNGYAAPSPLKSLVSGAKRGFSDALDGVSRNWGLSINGKPDAELGKGAVLYSPRGGAQVVGWPPIRSFRKNTMASNLVKNNDAAEGKSGSGCLYVKVSMDGAPYLRKVDLKIYSNYMELSSALEKMFSCFTIDGLSESRLMDLLHGSEYVLTYEDKDGDWMLVGDVPWDMFTETCRRLRIMKGSEAIGLGIWPQTPCERADYNR
ncbi:auxin-responsive protein IAA8 [Citrus sinensis]|uniref:Auxin-responsive protein IAA8 n=1 Tax=Citrus sinensis TaxID=2711 RepID=A0ACB8J956_CITSI|nr:auxin-responsive protein IAA8 [Citrus sinensis]